MFISFRWAFAVCLFTMLALSSWMARASEIDIGEDKGIEKLPNLPLPINMWKTTGNGGTSSETNFLGTTDEQPLELRVRKVRAARFVPCPNDADHSNMVNVILGASVNKMGTGVYASVIGGGGTPNWHGQPFWNEIYADFAVIGGGMVGYIGEGSTASLIAGGAGNWIDSNAAISVISGGNENHIFHGTEFATISGGAGNIIESGCGESVIGGGMQNIIFANSFASSISGGSGNRIRTLSARCTVAGGGNVIESDASDSTIAGGHSNVIGTNATQGTICGGYCNKVFKEASSSFIGGGTFNFIQDGASDSTICGGALNAIRTNATASVVGGGKSNAVIGSLGVVPGGDCNVAAANGFAAGHRAKAIHDGAFVWADAQDADFSSAAANEFSIRASGGVRFVTSAGPAAAAAGTGVTLAPGSGTWTSQSDVNSKDHFEAVDSAAVLDKLAAVPVRTWNYKSQDASIRHIGPSAQDFKQAFGVGESDTGIAAIDADGVSFAAIQALHQENTELRRANSDMRSELADIRARLAALESR